MWIFSHYLHKTPTGPCVTYFADENIKKLNHLSKSGFNPRFIHPMAYALGLISQVHFKM